MATFRGMIIPITIPQKNNVRCLICKTRVQPEDYSMIEYAYYRNKLNCRLFLRDAPEAMAAPISDQGLCDDGGSFYVIFTKDFFEDPTFQNKCVTLNIEVVKQLDPIPTSVFENCLRHTIEYKLAPQWNKVGLYLVEGQDFLSSTEYINAIQLEVENIHDNTAQLQVETLMVKIPFLKLMTVDSQPSEVYVLPSLSKANVRQKWNKIQEHHSFRNYEHLCAYWQNVHGYVLPNYKENLLFCDVEFPPYEKVYMYPEMCLTSGLLKEVHIPNPIFDNYIKFMKDLGEMRLCGQRLNTIIQSSTIEITFGADGMSVNSVKHP